jgi:uncharacterized protein (DUF1330 family)
MSCFLIAQIAVHDRDEYQKYLDGFDAIFAKYRGAVMAADEAPTVLEGEWPFTRTVLIKFSDAQEARRWYDSPEYQELAKHRHQASKTNLVLVERG